jgi:orotate phosphoribosyltransferase
MPTLDANLMKLILDSKALSIWNHKTGPVFWYVAGVPGPFYLNTELMIGQAVAEKLLERITAILAETPDVAARAKQVEAVVMGAYRQTPDFQTVVQALIAKAKQEFPNGTYDIVSGGERRDWLFSLPFAIETGVPHLFLFKDGSVYGEPQPKAGSRALHISDLINNAASYIDVWLPALERAGIACAGTLTVNTRGSAGIDRLQKVNCKVVALNRVDLDFFKQLQQNQLIDAATLDEIAIYFSSSQQWAERYLTQDEKLYAISTLDKKSRERMQSFFDKDPWGMQAKYGAFFDRMRVALATQRPAA